MKRQYYIQLFLLLICISASAKNIETFSPDMKLEVRTMVAENVSLQIWSGKELLFEIRDIRMETDRGDIPAANARIQRIRTRTVNGMVIPVIKEKQASIPENFNETIIDFKGNCKLLIRVYNEGIAYRMVTSLPGELTIKEEHADFVFDENSRLTFQYDLNANSAYEEPYIQKIVSDLKAGDKGNLPALLELPSSKKILFLEAAVNDYPVMWINKNASNLEAFFWKYPAKYYEKGSSRSNKRVTQRQDFLAKTKGSREFPWRIFAVTNEDTNLLKNQLVYLMAPELKIQDPSWIHPGWVILDWWARREIFGVDFKAGINTATAKYIIDFASEYGIRYFLLDDGWTKGDDLTKVIPELDIQEVVTYAKSKNVDVMLWVAFSLFDAKMEAALDQFQKWGIKGVKIDFINRSDQEAVNFYWRAAEQCANHQMVIDFHGAFKPDGLRRAYPNVLTREALIEFEQNGGTDNDNPDHHCTLPFIRNVAGPMDYIPGTMFNSTKQSFRQNREMPIGQGTRAHSMAMAVIAESPMQMLSDAPSEYYREVECTRFLTKIPTEWDQIVPLKGKVGDYVALARRHGNEWYVAAITDWDSRNLELDFSFLPETKEYNIELFKDGINSDIRANDYKKEIRKVKKGDRINISLASGGGWVARITPDR